MINIVLKGVDEFLGADVEKVLLPQVSKVLNIPLNEIIVTCLHSMIYHDGVDQTSFHMVVTFEMERKFQEFEKKLIKCVLDNTKNFSVHAHVNFLYLSETYSRIDEDYPLFVTSSNEVVIEDEIDETEEEIYTGDVFADFEKQLKKN